MATTGWDRSLGTSKQEQGILTPPAPKYHKCGCLYRGLELMQMCQSHAQGMQKIMAQLMGLAQEKKESAAEILKKQTQEPKSEPWVEKVKVSEDVQIGITTPGENK